MAKAMDNLQPFNNILGLLAGYDAFFFGSGDGKALYLHVASDFITYTFNISLTLVCKTNQIELSL
jgi:hypothetical protein